MRDWLKLISLVVVALLVSVGCSKKAKVNLDGLDENPVGSMSEDGTSRNGFYGPGETGAFGDGMVSPMVPAGPGDGSFTSVMGGNGAGANGGTGVQGITGWQDANGAISVDPSIANFVKNGQYFVDKVYFDFNRSEVRPSERPKLEKLANHLLTNGGLRVVIEGHCDERGSDEYNRSLSERRSLAVMDYLVSLGVDSSRMRTVSYGEDQPEIKNARTEQEHQLNRRAQFLVGTP